MSQEMCLSLELLAALIAGRQALSLHSDGNMVVQQQGAFARVRVDGFIIWGSVRSRAPVLLVGCLRGGFAPTPFSHEALKSPRRISLEAMWRLTDADYP